MPWCHFAATLMAIFLWLPNKKFQRKLHCLFFQQQRTRCTLCKGTTYRNFHSQSSKDTMAGITQKVISIFVGYENKAVPAWQRAVLTKAIPKINLDGSMYLSSIQCMLTINAKIVYYYIHPHFSMKIHLFMYYVLISCFFKFSNFLTIFELMLNRSKQPLVNQIHVALADIHFCYLAGMLNVRSVKTFDCNFTCIFG